MKSIFILLASLSFLLLFSCDNFFGKESDKNVKVEIKQQDQEYEYIGNVTAKCYGFRGDIIDSKSVRLEKKGEDVCAVIGKRRYHVTFKNINIKVESFLEPEVHSYNAFFTEDMGNISREYFFNY